MEEIGLLKDLLVVFLIAGVVVYLFHKLRLPAVVGLLAAGVLFGPEQQIGLIHEDESVRLLAEIGVVVLLFTVGLEFSLCRLCAILGCDARGRLATSADLRRRVVSGDVLVLRAWNQAAFRRHAGGHVEHGRSSQGADRSGRFASPHGRIAVAVLLFQDLLVMVFMLSLPLLAPDKAREGIPPLQGLLLGVTTMVGILLATRYVIPRSCFRSFGREIASCFCSPLSRCAWERQRTYRFQWSVARAGSVPGGAGLSDSEYAHQTLAEVLPFRDTLASLFFVSVGMLLDVGYVASHLELVSLTVVAWCRSSLRR